MRICASTSTMVNGWSVRVPLVVVAQSSRAATFTRARTHVGAHYDLTEDGVDWRVMVIGMETGRGDEHVSIAERTADQNRAISMTFNQRHAHMRGTTSVLRTAFGREYGADRAGELPDLRNQGEVVHLMNAYALVNLRLCSATKGTGYRSAASSILSSNCFPIWCGRSRYLSRRCASCKARVSTVISHVGLLRSRRSMRT